MRIGILALDDVRNKRLTSGTPYYMWKSLEKHCGEIELLCTLPHWIKLVLKALNLLSKIIFFFLRKRFKFTHSFFMARLYAAFFQKQLARKQWDVIFTPVSSTGIALLKTKVPIVYFSDTTVAALIDYYPDFSNMFPSAKKKARLIEAFALSRASLCIFSSEWAADSVRKFYGIDPAKIRVCALGANIDNIPSPSEVDSSIQNRINSKTIGLLFLGTEWSRKGGDTAIEAAKKLHESGESVQLSIIGCTPPADASKADYVNIMPFLDKKKERDNKILSDLFLKAHFLILPTCAECTPIVFSEAAAFGVPVISTNTGGVPSVVSNGANGFLLAPGAKGSDYAKLIAEIYKDKNRYNSLAKSSRKEYEKRLNWDTWGMQMAKEISAII